jgi:hypothetical protein
MSNEARVKVEESGNVFYPNSLDAFDNSTYNFTLYMISPEDMTGRNYGTSRRKIIAQSGVTQDFGIDDVEIDSYPSIVKSNGSGTSTNIDFTVTEPLGASLFDKLFAFAGELELENYRKAMYFLELKFRGHNYDGGYGGELEANTWIWPLVILSINTTVNGSGSTYEFKAAVSGDTAYSDTFGTIKEAISVQASTVGETLDLISKQLSKRQEAAKDNYVGVADEWIFEFDGNISEYPIVPTTKNTSSSKMGSYSAKDPKGKTNVQFGVGTSITRMIESIIVNTEEFQKKAKASGKADGRDKNKEKNPAEFSTLFRVYADVELGKYDTTRGDYSKKIRYYIKEYEMISLPQEQEEISKISENNVKKITDSERIRKRYDYIFTGLNDQVIDIDLDFNFAFYQTVPTNAGRTANPDSKSQSAATVHKTTESERDAVSNKNVNAESADANTKDGSVGQGSLTDGSSNNDTNSSVEDKFGSGKNILSSLFNQAKGGDMITMDLKIKGDPYWLEPMPYRLDEGKVSRASEFSLKEKIKADKKRNKEFAYTKDGDLFILFNCGLPTMGAAFGSDSSINRYNALSGIYRVIKVSNNFDGGKFQQTLGLARVTSINVDETTIRKVI